MTARRAAAGLRLPTLLILWFCALAGLAGPAALAAEPTPSFRARAEQVLLLFKGKPTPGLFSPAFLEEVPEAKVKMIAARLVQQYGPAKAITRVEGRSAYAGLVFVDLDRASLRLDLAIEPGAPHRIASLFIAPPEPKGDTLAKITQELSGLTGPTSLAIARLDGAEPAFELSDKADQPLGVGSAYKLFLLAELSRSIAAGERKWSDVVTLDRLSIPTGILQSWPKNAPVTLHTLASLMISQSDNSAADTMLSLLGREKVEALLPRIGVRETKGLKPLLSTREAALLKAGPDQTLLERWEKGDEADRRALLAGPLADILPGRIDIERLMARPRAVATVEWFASTSDLVRVMNWLRLSGGKDVLDILAINNGVGSSTAAGFEYLGYKGGSEAGVMNMTFLVRTRAGSWRALSATWNNSTAKLDEARFQALVSRALILLK